MTIRQAIDTISRAAIDIYGEREAYQIGRILVMELGGYSPTQLVVKCDEECQIDNLDWVVEQVASARPVQYIVGETEFCGLTFKVSEEVLIPRPETEELVMWIVQDYRSSENRSFENGLSENGLSESRSLTPSIVDIGTGSGAIAVSLAKLIEGCHVWGVDISVDALGQSRANAELNGVEVEFVEGDALKGVENYLADQKFDIVVSNPPYIPRGEGDEMQRNVMEFEPHLALFVEDCDPLIFYREIAKSAFKLLTNCGKLYFEIHESFEIQTIEMLEGLGYRNIVCRKDINQKPRMICAQR